MAIPPEEVSAERALVPWSDVDAEDDARSASPSPEAATGTFRIRQVEIVGFKSFRDRTVLRFNSGVTGIVGPNGCGKSNVVDAIRWVLGEQSAKRLRGSGMEDVVFAGNDRQAPLGMAQVSVLFESEGIPLDQFALLKESGHPLAQAGAADVMVTRRYLRSGESEYLLNGVPCRLRDVTELFLGTGLGGRAYAIIEQGRVDQLIGAKPEDIRLFIEEAAGTTLYRSRRQVAERKMERATENLARVQDILREVERQLATLRRQAKRAEQYRELQRQVETLDLDVSSRERARLLRELDELTAAREEAVTREVTLVASLERHEDERRELRAREGIVRDAVQVTQEHAFAVRARRDVNRHETERLAARVEELVAQDAATRGDIERARAEQTSVVDEHASAVAQLAVLEERLLALVAELHGLEVEQEVLVAAASEATAALDAGKRALADAFADETRVRGECVAIEQRQVEAGAVRVRLVSQGESLRAKEALALEQATHAEGLLVELQGRLEVLEGSKRQHAEDLRRILAERASWEATLDGMKEGLALARSRRDSLRELEESHAGYGDGVRAVLSASMRDETLAIVAEVLEIPAEYERAVAAVLGEQLQGVVMRNQDAARDAVQALRRADAGRVTCVPMAPRVIPAAAVPAGARCLRDLIHVRPGYERVADALLGGVLLVSDLEVAIRTFNEAGGGWSFATLAGETIDAIGAIAGGTERAEETLLAQRRELRTLDLEVQRRDAELGAARRRQEELAEAVTLREQAARVVDDELTQVAVQLVGSEKDVQRARQEIRDLQEHHRTAEAEIAEAAARIARLAADSERLRDELRAAESHRREREAAVNVLQETHVATLGTLTAGQQRIVERRIDLAEERARRDGLAASVERLGRAVEEVQRRLTLLGERLDADARAVVQTREAFVAAEAERAELDGAVAAALAEVERAEGEAAAARAATEALEAAVGAAQGELDGVRARAAHLEVQGTERRMMVSHLEATVRERYGRELAEVAHADEEDPGTAERLTSLRQRLSGMGEVNVAALSEVAELEERSQFLEGQRGDLERALDDLRKTIARLNRASKAKFRETFEQVDATFRDIFPKLFQGGRAQLRLTDDEHILESGVEIVVQPPGKRVGSLELLSGGEKALTAVSLIFALFLTKPSPFCVLDEVDAPLDDANIGRFNAMVREMSAHSQFILITHNKRTMEVAETLYGVTMEEPGVSKLVSVRLPS